jgi:hypothetical protein
MLTTALLLGALALAIGLNVLLDSLRAVPHSNEDWVWY